MTRRRPAPRPESCHDARPRGPRSRRVPRASAGMVAALVTSTVPPGRSSSRARSDVEIDRLRVQPRQGQLGQQVLRQLGERGHAPLPRSPRPWSWARRWPGRAGRSARSTPGPSWHRSGPPSGRRRARGSPRASGTRASPARCRAASARAAATVTRLVVSQAAVATGLVVGVHQGPQLTRGRADTVRGPQHADPCRSWPPAAPVVRRPARCPATRSSAAGSVQGRSSSGSTSAIRREKTRPSSREFEASRLAPWTPEQATSPVA